MDILSSKDIAALNLIRAKYVNRRMARADSDEEGQWVTSESGQKIHLNAEGAIDGGSQYALAVMGKPRDAKMPTGRVAVKDHKPYNLTAENRASLAKALSSRKEKNVVFGGFYKVRESGGSFTKATFFNPYTGDCFTEVIDDRDNDMVYNDAFNSELRAVKINDDVARLFNRSCGLLQSGDTVRVVKGRTIPHGTEAKVTAIRPMRDRYRRWVADYAYLDNGQKININNVKIVDGDDLIDIVDIA